jgi:hypothetical protein
MKIAHLHIAPILAVAACTAQRTDTTDTADAFTPAPAVGAFSCRIDSTSIAAIRLGMSLGDTRDANAGKRFERTSDGDGAALVAVKIDTTDLMILHAGEDDSQAPIDWTKEISFIETFHPSCTTATGVRPGVLVTEAQNVLGPVVRIIESEIESRQYITFERQPAWLTLRLDYTGIFPAGSRETTTFKPEARILSVSISRHN